MHAADLHLCIRAPRFLFPPPVPVQVAFKRTLLQDVKLFVVDAVAFRQDWEANGPTVPGLDPMDAFDRLRKFQQLFDVRGVMQLCLLSCASYLCGRTSFIRCLAPAPCLPWSCHCRRRCCPTPFLVPTLQPSLLAWPILKPCGAGPQAQVG